MLQWGFEDPGLEIMQYLNKIFLVVGFAYVDKLSAFQITIQIQTIRWSEYFLEYWILIRIEDLSVFQIPTLILNYKICNNFLLFGGSQDVLMKMWSFTAILFQLPVKI